jgi:acetyl-CoA carboxylase biotin carboxyl carrier protein
MELKEISEFIKQNGNFSSLTVRNGDFFFEMKKDAPVVKAVTVAEIPADSAEAESEDIKTIESPFVGAYHDLPEDKKVKAGDKVAKGQAVCNIEAMKLFNEITMPEDGVIVSVDVKEGDVLEFGQTILRYRCE